MWEEFILPCLEPVYDEQERLNPVKSVFKQSTLLGQIGIAQISVQNQLLPHFHGSNLS